MNTLKNKLFVSLFITSMVVIFVSSCKEEDKDEESPVIDLVTPQKHDILYSGQEMHFTGTVTDNETVDHVEISVWEEENPDTLLFFVHLHPNAASVSLDTGFTIMPEDTTEYHFKVHAEDGSGNVSDTDPEDHIHARP